MADTVLYENQGKIVIITLNRPEVLNAINRQLAGELGEALVRFDHDEEAVVGIITGAGRAFCAGRDLKERAEDNTTGIQAKAIDSMSSEHPYMWPQTSKPLIAAINGYALAGGWSIAQICDLRLAAEDAKLGITESRVGLLPPFATILPRLIPMASVLELVFTAEPISAQRGWEIGFCQQGRTWRTFNRGGLNLGGAHRGQCSPCREIFQGVGLQKSRHEGLRHQLSDPPNVRPIAPKR